MEDQLQRIRRQATSKLANQQQTAATLIAVEETLNEQNTEITPSAYFATLATLLDQQRLVTKGPGMAHPILYLLNIILASVPIAIQRAKQGELIKCLAPYLDSQKNDAPILRPALGCLATLLIAQDEAGWKQTTSQQGYQTLMILAVDKRPKLRKEAQDALKRVVETAPTAGREHPAAPLATKLCLQLLKDCANSSEPQTTLHVITAIRHLAAVWTSSTCAPLAKVLVQLAEANTDVYVAAAVFETLRDLIIQQSANAKATEALLANLAAVKPEKSDHTVLAAWYASVGKAMVHFATTNPAASLAAIVDFFEDFFDDLEMGLQAQLHALVANALLGLVQDCLPWTLEASVPATAEATSSNPELTRLGVIVQKSTTYRYRDTLDKVLLVLAALVHSLGPRASPLLDSTIRSIADLRMQADFAHKAQADAVIKEAMVALGPARFLEILPQNLDPTAAAATSSGPDDQVGRAWLLPLLKESIQPTELRYFVKALLPLADQLAQTAEDFQSKSRDTEAKIYQTLVHQIWSLLPCFCRYGPTDVPQTFNQAFAERMSDVLYGEPELRSVVCSALRNLIRPFLNLRNRAENSEGDLTPASKATVEEAQATINHLAGFASNYMSVLFNVYNSVASDNRGFIMDAINTLLEITPPIEIQATYDRAEAMLNKELESMSPGSDDEDESTMATDGLSKLAANLLELVVAMVPYIEKTSLESLFKLVSQLLAMDMAASVQKKVYQILSHMLQRQTVGDTPGTTRAWTLSAPHQHALLTTLSANMAEVAPAAKKDRLRCLLRLIPNLADDQLHWIPLILSEAILMTKESNDRARSVAYDLISAMAERMKRGGTIQRSALGHSPEEEEEEAEKEDEEDSDSMAVTSMEASLEEYFTMVTAGLTSSNHTMTSATLSTLAALLFEFGTELSPDLVQSTLEATAMFTSTQVPEVAKAGFGLMKAAVLVLPPERVESHLDLILPAVMYWASRVNASLKALARHLVERMIRKFGVEVVTAACPEEHRRLISNIQQRKLAGKRKKHTDDASTNATRPTRFANAYEEAIHGSDDDDDDEEEDSSAARSNRKGPSGAAAGKPSRPDRWIQEKGGQPLDLLDESVHTRITTAKPQPARRGPAGGARKAAAFQVNEQGKYIIEEPTPAAAPGSIDTSTASAEKALENLYLESITSADGFTRVNNRIRFNKRKAGGADDSAALEDGEGESQQHSSAGGPAAKRSKGADRTNNSRTLGSEFKSKKAAGDVKKAGKHEPYAYVPLSTNSKNKASIVGKRGRGRK
ncbi:NUC173 domain-containing protein [Dimargaris cristalligena]|uniref:NUC173 domain-containing protein n=1 Tax=Dimargaris cristalligena TaxID=215637 RepID=A0A4P9ZRX1_9FUNG|nr:NUC173 domain-containing protein [Dimargaris cristalligena]|eukprot:RKP35521.1 NUC173 domain-containing protein [Dimargaris cristalligena]